MNKKVVIFWIAAIAIACLYATIQVTREESRRLDLVSQAGGEVSELKIMGSVAKFSFTSSENRTVSNEDLKGKIWVFNLMQTDCKGPCALMTHHMSQLHLFFLKKPLVHFVSLTINPENDSFEALNKFAKGYHSDSSKWSFLTGSKENIQSFAAESLKLPLNFKTNHYSTRLVLIDSKGNIRGYFDSQSKSNMELLRSSINLLIKQNT